MVQDFVHPEYVEKRLLVFAFQGFLGATSGFRNHPQNFEPRGPDATEMAEMELDWSGRPLSSWVNVATRISGVIALTAGLDILNLLPVGRWFIHQYSRL